VNTLPLVLDLIIAQALLGAFDTLYHHEWRAALPRQPSAALELKIHAGRSFIYGLLFVGLAWAAWGGVWLLLLAAMLLTEVVLTLWDFLVEDRSRILPPAERVLHTIMALNGGAAFAFLCLFAPLWWRLPNRLLLTTHGWQSLVLTVFTGGVVASAVRDARAGAALRRRGRRTPDIHFAPVAQSLLITGGTGFIGQELCRALLADGHKLTLLARDPLKTAYLFEGRVHCVTGLSDDDLDPGTRFDVVINLAGERILGPRWTPARRHKLIESRIGTTIALVGWIARATHKPGLMISASAVGYYGVQDPGDPTALTETSASQADFVSGICQRWEDAARGVSTCSVPLAILRLGIVLGHQGALPLMRLPFLAGVGGRLGSGRQVVSWIHIEDVLGAIAHVMANPDAASVEGVYNLTAPQPVTQNEFARTLARVLHRPSLLPMPAGMVRIALGEQAMLLLQGQRAWPSRLLKDGYLFHFPELEPALRDLCS